MREIAGRSRFDYRVDVSMLPERLGIYFFFFHLLSA